MQQTTTPNTKHFFLTLLGFCWLLALCPLPAARAQNAIRYVKPGGTGDGTNWQTATGNFQGAIDAVANAGGGQVWVAAGTYTPTTDPTNRDASFSLRNGVAIYGGFAGTETELTQRDWQANPTILSGDIDNDNTLSGNSYHIFYHPDGTNLDGTAVLDGFVLTGGNADGSLQGNEINSGGAMFNKGNRTLGTGSNPTLTNCTFQGNYAYNGGAMYNFISRPTLTNCTFQGNTAGEGGAMHNIDRAGYGPSLTDCTFQGNTAGEGGAVYTYSGSPSLIRCTFQNNSVNNYGGAMYNYNSNPSLTDCIFQDNSAYFQGGAMYNENSSPTLTNCLFRNNLAAHPYNSDIGSGGAMHNFDRSSPTLIGCSFQGNASVYAGAILNQNGSNSTLTNCSFQGNSASKTGGAIYNNTVSSLTLINSAFWNNGGANTIYNPSSTLTARYCLFDASVTGYTDGGNNRTTTTSPFVSESSTELSPCSPAIDAGDNSANTTLTDLAGNPRKVRTIDLGAYEYQGELSAPPAITNQPMASQNVVQNGPVTDLTVVATGTGLRYQWYSPAEASNEGGEPIQNATGSTYTPPSGVVGEFYYYVQVTNTCGESLASEVARVVVEPCPVPVVTAVTVPTDPVAISSPVTMSIGYTDTNISSATIDWGDDTAPQTVSDPSAAQSHTYATAGVYTVRVTLTNDCGQTSEPVSAPQYVVVYDPSAGFVTGGGWINSPEKAYAADPNLVGKATFGFVSKYQKGATVPTGNTEFEFKAGKLNFKSTTYQWLTVAGARAQFKGSGSLNGTTGYDFMLTAIDGQVNGGGNVDKFRIKIWNGSGVVYDNQNGAGDTADPTTELGGGSIVIHVPKGKGARESYEPGLMPATGALTLRAYPNPTAGQVRVEVYLSVEGEAQFEVLDLTGRSVQRKAAILPAGLQVVEFDLSAQPAGLYLIRSRDAAGRQGAVRVSRQ